MSVNDLALFDLAAGLLAVLAALGALAVGLHRAGWAMLALAGPVISVLLAALFAVRGLSGPASGLIGAGGVLGLMCAAAAALVPAHMPPRPRPAMAIVAAAAGISVFAAVIWAGADLIGGLAPYSTPAPPGAQLWLAAICATAGLIVWGVLGFGERAARALPRGAQAPNPSDPRHHASLRILLKALAPIAAGFAVITVVVAGPPFGLAGGAAGATAIGLFALLFGPAVALRALPPAGLGAALSLGLLSAVAAAAWGQFGDPSAIGNAKWLAGFGLTLIMAGAASLAMLAAMGRVGDLGEGGP